MEWSAVQSVGVGVGVLSMGGGVLYLCVRAAKLLDRASTSLDEVDRQLQALAPPIARTLTHVGGIADTADATLARLGTAVGALENIAGGVAKTANIAQSAVNPAMMNLGGTLATVTAGLLRIVNGKAATKG